MDAKDGPSQVFSYDENFRKRLISNNRFLWVVFVVCCVVPSFLVLAMFLLGSEMILFVLSLLLLPTTALIYFLLKSNQRALRAYGDSLVITEEYIIHRTKDGRETKAHWPDIAFIKEKAWSYECELISQAGNVLLTFVRSFEEAQSLYEVMQQQLLKWNAPCTQARTFHRESYLTVLYSCMALLGVFGNLFIDSHNSSDSKFLGQLAFVSVASLLALMFSTRKVLIGNDRIILMALCLRRAILFDNIVGSPLSLASTRQLGVDRSSVYIRQTGWYEPRLSEFQEGTIMIGATLERALRDFREKKTQHENLSV